MQLDLYPGGGSAAPRYGSGSGGGSTGMLFTRPMVSCKWGLGRGGGLLGPRGGWLQPVVLLSLLLLLLLVHLKVPLVRLLLPLLLPPLRTRLLVLCTGITFLILG